MTNRKIAILLLDDRRIQNVRNIVSVLMANAVCDEITVFSENPLPGFDMAHERTRCSCQAFPQCDKPDLETAKRNAVLKKYEGEGYDGILHVISDDIELLKDPSAFIGDLESMMREFDYPLWLSTVTDPCNYVYEKYNPRMVLGNDMPALREKGITYGLAVTSHSNTGWMAYDLHALAKQKDIEYFCEEFTVAMFYIIELLARRREHKAPGQLFFMNQYVTVDSEHGVFELLPSLSPKNPTSNDVMKAEDEKFKEMNVKYEPDFSLDSVIDAITEKILEKTEPKNPRI